ncbi:MAG: bifunctional adenosylcobinamide kinase/adenosylcobinamide-phosphate guanylyltransferase [Parahaliea sp.]
MKHLVIGGARSGKSRYGEQWAEQQARSTGKQLFYIATAQALDREMRARIERHQYDRGPHWQLHEEALLLHEAIAELDAPQHCLLIDCLTLWLSNCITSERWHELRTAFIEMLLAARCDIVMVGNEVGQGIVPLGELNRCFVDESGWLHQELARHCEQVTLVSAGLPLTLKPSIIHQTIKPSYKP